MQDPHARPSAAHPQSYHRVSANLAHQPYEVEPVATPVAPPRSPQRPEVRQDRIELDPLQARSRDVQKPITPPTPRRTPPAPNVSPSFRTARPPRSPFAAELQQLEALADRINHILVERARYAAPLDTLPPVASDTQTRVPIPTAPHPGQSPVSPPAPLNQAETAALKHQAQRIRHRLAQLEAAMAAESHSTPSFGAAWDRVEPQPAAIAPPSFQSPPSSQSPPETTWAEPPAPSPVPDRANPFDPILQQREYHAWQAVAELQFLKTQAPRSPHPQPVDPQPVDPQPVDPQPAPRLRRLRPIQSRRPAIARSGLSRPLPVWLDAGLWAIAGALLRQLINALAVALPTWTPILNALLFAPAIFAIVVMVLVPQPSQVPFYRLLMMTVGILAGGKLA